MLAVSKNTFARSGYACIPTATWLHWISICCIFVNFCSTFVVVWVEVWPPWVASFLPNFYYFSLLIFYRSYCLYCSSLCFWILSSSSCLFIACSYAILLASIIYLPYLTRFFSRYLAYYYYLFFLASLAFSVSYFSFCLASSSVIVDYWKAVPCNRSYSSKSGSYRWSSIHFCAFYKVLFPELIYYYLTLIQLFMKHF